MNSKPAAFFAELKRRNVYRAAAFYAASAWLLVQITTQVLPFYSVPGWAVRWLIGALAFGFPFVIVLAWFYEFTGHGLRRETEIERDSVTPHAGKRIDRWITALLALAVVLLLANQFVPHRDTDSTQAASAPPRAKSIAVLPFTDLSPGHDQEYFSDGMAEEILNALAQVKDLKVAGRTSSFRYKNRNEDLRAIGNALGVANILEGSVRKQGDKVRITAQLIQVSDDSNLWSRAYDGDLSDVFQLQEDIARAITGQLKVVLVGEQNTRLVPVATDNAEAHALYLQATAIYNRRDKEHLQDAFAALGEALRLDPHFAHAQARLAALYVEEDNRPAAWTKLAETNARAAIALDGNLAEPYAVLGRLYFTERRFAEAHAALKHALELEPQDVTANFWWAMELIMTGYRREGLAQLDRALALDPGQGIIQLWRAMQYSFAGDQLAAQRAAQRSADLGLRFAAYAQMEVAHAQGDDAKARAYLQGNWHDPSWACGARTPDEPYAMVEAVYGGDAATRAQALAMVERCVAARPDPMPFWEVNALLRLDRPERALQVAQMQLTNNETFLFQILWSPYGDAARRLPGFAAFARKVGLADVWDRYGAPDDRRRKGSAGYACT